MKTTEKILSQLVVMTFIVMGVFAAIEISIQRQYLRSQSLSFHNTLMSNLYYGLTIGLFENNSDAIEFYLLGLAKEGKVQNVSLWGDGGEGLVRYTMNQGKTVKDTEFEQDSKRTVDQNLKYSSDEQVFINHSYPNDKVERFNVDLWFKEEGGDPYYVGHLEVDFDLSHINEQLFNMVLRYVYLFLFFNIAKILVMFVFIRQSIIKPIKSLVDHAVQVSKGLFPNIPKINKNDELSTLNNIVSDMTSSLEKHITSLDQLVAEKTAQLQIKTKDIQNMLQNLQQGIFTIDSDFKIHHEYSAHLEEIIEAKDLAGKDPMDLVFSHSNLGEDLMAQLESALDASLGSLHWAFELNAHCLPHELEYLAPSSGKKKILELDWQPLGYQEDGSEEIGDITIDKILVVIRDVSSLRELKAQAEQQQMELEMIREVLEIGPKKMLNFIGSQSKYLQENKSIIKQAKDEQSLREQLPVLFRNIHTVKGNCRSYKLSQTVNRLHSAEQYLASIRKNVDERVNSEIILNDAEQIEANLAKYKNLIDEKIGAISDEGDDFGRVFDKAIAENTNHGAEKVLASLIALRAQASSVQIPQVLETVVNSLAEISKELHKAKPKVVIAAKGIYIKNDKAQFIADVFTHLFRNSIDHGLELPDVRRSKGKLEAGSISLIASASEDLLQIDFFDDGAGLNLGYLRKKGVDQGIFTDEATDQEVGELIFHSGLSTAKQVSEISGRGVGMDAVRSFIEKEGGSISIEFSGSSDSQGYRPFKLVIILPKKICINDQELGYAA